MTRLPGAVVLAALVLAGCTRQTMDNQPRYEALEEARRFPDNQAARPLVPGTVPRDWNPGAIPVDNPRPLTRALLRRGREQFGVFCTPCHGLAGYGQGMIVQRGFPAPPSYHTPRLRSVSDGYLFRVITEGYGVMYAYAARVPAADRWAIVAYIRALQLSQWTRAAALPPERRRALQDTEGEAP